MKRPKLEVQKRTLLGKKVKKLRKEGLLPASIYGKNIKSQPLMVPLKNFDQVFRQVGEAGVVDLVLEKEEKTRPVLIHNLQLDPVTSQPLHTDFFQVDLKEKVRTMVPVTFTGEPQAVAEKKGVLLTTLNEVEVEALPTDLPEHIEVDSSSLVGLDQEIKVSELKVPPQVTVLTDPNLMVCKIGPLITKEMEETLEAEKKAAEEAKAEAAAGVAEEKAPPVEEAPAEEVPPEEVPIAGKNPPKNSPQS